MVEFSVYLNRLGFVMISIASNKTTCFIFYSHTGVVSSVSQVKTIYVQAGEQAILKCSITTKIPKWSSPSGELINYYDSTLVHPFHPDRDRLSVGGNGYLIINNTQLYDKGEYICSDRTNGSERISLVVGGQSLLGYQSKMVVFKGESIFLLGKCSLSVEGYILTVTKW